jgi:hypothetical protein
MSRFVLAGLWLVSIRGAGEPPKLRLGGDFDVHLSQTYHPYKAQAGPAPPVQSVSH